MKYYQSYTDNDLLQLLIKDDKQAFTALYHRYWKLLYAMAFKRLKDNQLAEDVIHDVLLSVWKNRLQLQIDTLQNYLVSATKYAVMGVIRKKLRQQQHENLPNVVSYESRTENALYYKQLFDFAMREMEMLPEKCKLVFKYSRQAGLSNREIAETLQISQKTVENQINKALHHLRFSMKRILLFFM